MFKIMFGIIRLHLQMKTVKDIVKDISDIYLPLFLVLFAKVKASDIGFHEDMISVVHLVAGKQHGI